LPMDLPVEIQSRDASTYVPLIEIPEEGINLQNVVTDMERELISQSLRRTNGNKKLAAKLLNLKRTTLIEKIKRIGLLDAPAHGTFSEFAAELQDSAKDEQAKSARGNGR